MVRVFSLFHAQFISLIGVQDEGSCGKKSLCEPPPPGMPGGLRATHGKRSLARKSWAV